jgi:hypothetical protein
MRRYAYILLGPIKTNITWTGLDKVDSVHSRLSLAMWNFRFWYRKCMFPVQAVLIYMLATQLSKATAINDRRYIEFNSTSTGVAMETQRCDVRYRITCSLFQQLTGSGASRELWYCSLAAPRDTKARAAYIMIRLCTTWNTLTARMCVACSSVLRCNSRSVEYIIEVGVQLHAPAAPAQEKEPLVPSPITIWLWGTNLKLILSCRIWGCHSGG